MKKSVTFYFPGTIVAECREYEVARWNVNDVLKMITSVTKEHDLQPYCFKFSKKDSPTYFLNGKVYNLEQIKSENNKQNDILIQNMEMNKYDVILTDYPFRWFAIFNENDIVLLYEK